jgi:replicative DNA helicase
MASVFPDRREQYLEKPLPSSEEAERVILGAILLDNGLIAQAVEGLKPEDFYSPLNRRVFSAMISLFEKHRQIDPILNGDELKKEGSLESIGGTTTITNLTFGLPHFSDIGEYITVVKDKSTVRGLIRACNSITSEALAEEDDAQDVLQRAEQTIFALAEGRTNEGFARIAPVAEKVFNIVKDRAQGEATGITGL